MPSLNLVGAGTLGRGAWEILTKSTPPAVTPPANQKSVEGASHLFDLGSFTDPDGGPWTVDVAWGDGTADTVFTALAPGAITSQNHTYGEEGTYTVTIKVTDTLDGQNDSKTFTVTVSDPAVLATGVAVSAVEGAAFTGKTVATFTDPSGAEPNPSDPTGTHYVVTSIDWGDSTPLDTTTGAISFGGTPGSTTDKFTVSGNHTYGEEGSFTIKVVLNHEGVSTMTSTTATASDPAVLAMGVPVNAIAGAACGAALPVPIATYTDPGGAEPNASDSGPLGNHYKVVSIDWGDATPLDTTTGSISYSGAPGSKTDKFTVTGKHTYLTMGTYTITIKLDHETIATMVMSSATVVDLNKPVQTNQTKTTNWLAGIQGQQMMLSFGLTASGQTLGQWLASTFPRLFGGVAGAPDLSGFTNAQVAAYYVNVFKMSPIPMLDSEVMATAIYVFTTTKSLGGNVGLAYGFLVNDVGLGAYDQNVYQHGQAFFVPNFTSLNVCKILSIANDTALGGHPWGNFPWNNDQTMRNNALAIFLLINQEKWY